MLYLYLVAFVQIVTESLPISSSGHVALVTTFFERYTSSLFIIEPQIFDAWFDSLHAITALILALFFFREWFFLLRNITRTWKIVFKLVSLALIADVITCMWYVFFHFFPIELPLIFGFCITGCILASLYWVPHGRQRRAYNVRDAVILGMVQGITLLPGISRFAATFAASRWLGYRNEDAFRLTWMIQWPLIAAASALGFAHLFSWGLLAQFYSGWFLIVYGCAGLLGYGALGVAYRMALQNHFWWFAYYLIVPILLCLV